mmetsp:Transcript_110154/g.351035  ORF Transcript_110154/g.351035 Transcript_110154/m.351035 type:complete len:338 (+) Transcript_110154:654-1667(+)
MLYRLGGQARSPDPLRHRAAKVKHLAAAQWNQGRGDDPRWGKARAGLGQGAPLPRPEVEDVEGLVVVRLSGLLELPFTPTQNEPTAISRMATIGPNPGRWSPAFALHTSPHPRLTGIEIQVKLPHIIEASAASFATSEDHKKVLEDDGTCSLPCTGCIPKHLQRFPFGLQSARCRVARGGAFRRRWRRPQRQHRGRGGKLAVGGAATEEDRAVASRDQIARSTMNLRMTLVGQLAVAKCPSVSLPCDAVARNQGCQVRCCPVSWISWKIDQNDIVQGSHLSPSGVLGVVATSDGEQTIRTKPEQVWRLSTPQAAATDLYSLRDLLRQLNIMLGTISV